MIHKNHTNIKKTKVYFECRPVIVIPQRNTLQHCIKYQYFTSFIKTSYVQYDLLLTGTEDVPEAVVTELNTMPQILSTQTLGVPL